jgi:hypothetical protein
VGLREHDQIGKARHRAVGIHDLAQHRGGSEPRKRRQIAAGLGVPRARKHAARLRDEREHVPGLHDVRTLGVGRRRHANRVRAILGGDPRRDPLRRLDRHGEVRAMDRAVLSHHRRKVEALGVFRGDRHADEPTAMRGEEIDLLGRDEIGGENEIAFVFAILFVDEDGHPPGFQVGDEIGNGAQGHGGRYLRCNNVHFTLGRHPPIRSGRTRAPAQGRAESAFRTHAGFN